MVLEKGNKVTKNRKSENVPDCLVYEEMYGMKVYYRGYKDVLTGKLTPEEIRGYGGHSNSTADNYQGLLIDAFWKKLLVASR